MKDFFTFKRMLTPIIIYTFFWISVLVCIGVGLYDMINGVFALGLIVLFLAPIAIRVVCEFFILFFRINETLTEMNNRLEKE